MSKYKRRNAGLGSGTGKVVKTILVVFLVVSLIPLLFSLGSSGTDRLPTEPNATEPTAQPTDPVTPTDPPEPVMESGYLLYQMDNVGSKKYLNIRDSSAGFSLKTNPVDACLYKWDSQYNTFFVVDPDVDRFFGVDLSKELTRFSTYARNEKYSFAQFIEATGSELMSGTECPLREGEAYWLAVQAANGEAFFYNGPTEGGYAIGTFDSGTAALVYVEYVTREAAG